MSVLMNMCAGRLVSAESGRVLDRVDPATGAPAVGAPDSAARDVDLAVAAARDVFHGWSRTPVQSRAAVLMRLAELIEANLDRLAREECTDSGKPISLARSVDVPRSAANFRFFATAVLHAGSECYHFDGSGVPGGVPALNYVLRRPRGVAGLITPWNLPLYLLSWKAAPALATGNTVVAKPSELTPTTASSLAELALEAGLPPGVLNVVHGRGDPVGAAIVAHPNVAAVSFTGSTRVGRWIGQAAGERLKPVSLELGGKNPFIVFDDADPAAALDAAVRAGFTNQGQVCLCGSRLLLHEGIAEEFLERFVGRVRALAVGDPLDPATQQGALISQSHLEKVDSYVRLARDLGGRVHCGGSPVPAADLPGRCRGGCFYRPTVISGLDPGCRVEQEEIFGPVVTVSTFRDDEEAVRLANGTPYGLAATCFTASASRAHSIAARLEAGIIWINCWMVRDLRTPFGGMKQSGVGREGGAEALRFFTEPTNVCVRTA
jgi:aminomuconate-semialdehyde/2-hydroxymuconate-6-semialdehyde dehydrogenase